MPSNEICLADVTACAALQPFCFAVSLAWHTLDLNDFDDSFVDSSQATSLARQLPDAICTSGTLLSPSDMRLRRQAALMYPGKASSTSRLWSALVKEQQESLNRPDGLHESDERWAGRGLVIAEFLRKVLQARDDPLDLLLARLTMHREDLCRNNLSKSSSITANEDIHGCSRIFRGKPPARVEAGSKAPPIHHLRPLRLEWAPKQKQLSTTLALDDGTTRVVFFWVPWMPHCRARLRLLLLLQQEELRATGAVTWELVTIALQPSKEQRELYPDLRTLAASMDKVDESSLRRNDADGNWQRKRNVTGQLVARPPPRATPRADTRVSQRPQSATARIAMSSYKASQSSATTNYKMMSTCTTAFSPLAVSDMDSSIRGSRAGAVPRSEPGSRSHVIGCAVRKFSDEMARSHRIATSLAVRLLAEPSTTIRSFVRGALPHVSAFTGAGNGDVMFSAICDGLSARLLLDAGAKKGERIGMARCDLLSSLSTPPEAVFAHPFFTFKSQVLVLFLLPAPPFGPCLLHQHVDVSSIPPSQACFCMCAGRICAALFRRCARLSCRAARSILSLRNVFPY
jgi:hypothetical protein